MKAIVKKPFVGFNRDFKPGETVDLSTEKIEQLNAAGMGTLLEAEENPIEWPKKLPGGFYELSNGKKVRGKEAATEAQAILDSEEEVK